MKLSCSEFTAPVEVPVVDTAKSTDAGMPKRTSLPSSAAPAASAAGPFGWVSVTAATVRKAAQITPITATSTAPWRRSRTIVPNVRVRHTGITSSRKISNRFVSAFGFSNGCAELALKIPPPFVPSSLIASCDAAGASGIVYWVPSTLVTSKPDFNDITTPTATRTIAATNEIGSRMRTAPRVRSTQKLPRRSARSARMPRISATATARPTAADTTFCTVNPAIAAVSPTTCSGT